MIFKSREDDELYSLEKPDYVGTLFEMGAYWIWRSNSVHRLVITQDGYIVILKEFIGQNTLGLTDPFPDINIDEYIKDNPDRVLVRKCESLAYNVGEALFTSKYPSHYKGIKPALVQIPQMLSFNGCDGGYLSISLCDGAIRTKGHAFSFQFEYFTHKHIGDKLDEIPSATDKSFYIISRMIIIDTLLNIAKAVMMTDIKKDQVPEKYTVEQVKEDICKRLLGRMLDERDVKDYISGSSSEITYYSWIPWFKELYCSN